MAENGAMFPGKSDIDNLIDSLNPGDDKANGVKGSIPKNPDYSSLNSMIGNLGLAVPTGFWLIHNDLTDILKQLKNGGSGGGGAVSTAANVVTAISTTASAVTDIISAIKSPAGLGNILDNEEINDLLAHDPDVYTIRLAGTKGYLKAYYQDMINTLGFEWDMETGALTESTGKGSGTHDFASGLASFAGSLIQNVGSAIMNLMEESKLNSIPEILEIRKEGYVAYLKAYYSNLLTEFNLIYDWDTHQAVEKTTGWSLFGKIGKGLGDFFGGIVGGTANALGTAINNGILDTDPDVHAIRKEGYIAYLKAYYSNTLTEFNLVYDWDTHQAVEKTTGWSLFGKIGKGLGDLFGGIVGGTASALGTAINNAVLDADPDVHALRKEGYIAYLKAYWITTLEGLGFALQDDGSIVSLNDGRESRKGLFTSIKEAFTGDISTQLSNSLVTQLKNNMGTIVSQMAKNGEFSRAANFYNDFLIGYFDVLKNQVINKPDDWKWASGTIKTFNNVMAAKLPEMELTQDVKTTIINEGRDYTIALNSIRASIDTMKNSISNIMSYINTNIVPDVSTIATNSGKTQVYAAGGTSRFSYENMEPQTEE